jgi:hypothetical protein
MAAHPTGQMRRGKAGLASRARWFGGGGSCRRWCGCDDIYQCRTEAASLPTFARVSQGLRMHLLMCILLVQSIWAQGQSGGVVVGVLQLCLCSSKVVAGPHSAVGASNQHGVYLAAVHV